MWLVIDWILFRFNHIQLRIVFSVLKEDSCTIYMHLYVSKLQYTLHPCITSSVMYILMERLILRVKNLYSFIRTHKNHLIIKKCYCYLNEMKNDNIQIEKKNCKCNLFHEKVKNQIIPLGIISISVHFCEIYTIFIYTKKCYILVYM